MVEKREITHSRLYTSSEASRQAFTIENRCIFEVKVLKKHHMKPYSKPYGATDE